jgi:hypothetical protein
LAQDATRFTQFYVPCVNTWGPATHLPVNTPHNRVAAFKGVQVNRSDFSVTMPHKFDKCLNADPVRDYGD